jgi:heme-degrading monooxygenase HmoA
MLRIPNKQMASVTNSEQHVASSGEFLIDIANAPCDICSDKEGSTMITVLFENDILEGKRKEFDSANKQLLELVKKINGFISVEQFSPSENRVVTVGKFSSEAGVKAWRESPEHQEFQRRLRKDVLKDYRLIVAPAERDYTMFNRAEAIQNLPPPNR